MGSLVEKTEVLGGRENKWQLTPLDIKDLDFNFFKKIIDF